MSQYQKMVLTLTQIKIETAKEDKIMGTINNTFTVAEIMFDYKHEDKQAAAIQDVIAQSEFKNYANLVQGINGYYFLTIAPSGSKEGWHASKLHKEFVDNLINFIEKTADFVNYKTVTTSCG